MEENKEKQPHTENPAIESNGQPNYPKLPVLDEKINPLDEANKRREEITKTNKKLFLDYYKATLGSILAVCKKIEISYEIFKVWRREDSTFAQALIDADDEIVLMHREQLNEHIIKKNLHALKYYLDRRDALFMPKQKMDTHIHSDKSWEDVIDEFEKEKNATTNEPGTGDKGVADKGQEGKGGAVPQQQGATVVLAEKDKEKHLVETQAGGAK